LAVNSGATAQIPAQRLVSWQAVGVQHRPATWQTINVATAGADLSGLLPVDALVNSLIANAADSTELFFPSGSYLFAGSINMKSFVRLRGEGSATKFIVQMNTPDDFIKCHGVYSGPKIYLKDNALKSNTILITDANAPLLVDQFYRLFFTDTAYMFSPWAYNMAGQIYHIWQTTNSGSATVNSTSSSHRMHYLVSDSAYVMRLLPIQQAGIECLSIEVRDSSAAQLRNISFKRAVNCWVRGVASNRTNFAHIVLECSKQCSITGNYLHHGFGYGGGGRAYGVVCQDAACENLIEDNVMEHLRHAMLVQGGANGNVYGYNADFDPHWDNVVPNSNGNIAVHGNYPYCNLFEGNVLSHIWSDDSHGKNGPYNTFFRNRMYAYGFTITSGDSLNIVGNEVTASTPIIGSWNLGGSLGNFIQANNVVNAAGTAYSVVPVASAPAIESSLYLNAHPTFLWNSSGAWPLIGLPVLPKTWNSAAVARYDLPQLTQCVDVETSLRTQFLINFTAAPNPSTGLLSIKSDNHLNGTLSIFNALGQQVASYALVGNTSTLDLRHLPKGLYVLKVAGTARSVLLE
jgi:hypothetical protein